MKTTSYVVSVAGRVLAGRAGADDALFVGEGGRVLEATGSNLFCVFADRLSTPPKLVVRTNGARGGRFETADGERGSYEPVAPPGPVVDTYGAGDCFAAGLTFALASGLEAAEAVALAARCGAWNVAGRGPFGNLLTAADL